MLVFPSTDKELCERLGVSLRYQVSDCLLLVLMPWHLPPSKYNVLYYRPDELHGTTYDTQMDEVLKEYSARLRTGMATAFRILGFDRQFLSFLPQRKYCVWSFGVDAAPTERGRKFTQVCTETKALFEVMSFLKAENAGYESRDVRVVFVHVGSVRSIQKLPYIVQRRCEAPEVRFVTYGSHESVRPSLWGFREIYPLGIVLKLLHFEHMLNEFRRWCCHFHRKFASGRPSVCSRAHRTNPQASVVGVLHASFCVSCVRSSVLSRRGPTVSIC